MNAQQIIDALIAIETDSERPADMRRVFAGGGIAPEDRRDTWADRAVAP